MKFDRERLRLIICLISTAILVTTNIFLFGTLGVFLDNTAEFEVGFINMIDSVGPWVWGFFLLILIPGLLPVARLRRYVALVLALGILTWAQASFLLWDYGVFDGRDTNWGRLDSLGWLDLALWIGLSLIFIRYAKRVLPFANMVAWVLIIGQTVLLLDHGVLKQVYRTEKPASFGSPPGAILEVSGQRNIVHIILDSMQSDVFLELIDEAELRDEFEGFTLFYENAGVAPHTSLSIPASFSGEIFDGSQPASSYYKHAMTKGFQNELHDAGFTINLIPQLSMLDSKYTNYYEIPGSYRGTFENLEKQNAAQLIDVSLFRSVPHFLRKAVYDGGEWFLLEVVRDETSIRSFQEKAFLSDYTQALRVGDDTPAYHFMHLYPPHPPYVTLADGSYAGEILPNTREHYLNESRAIIELIVQYIERLKSLGVYDDTMFILQGDHGSQIKPVINGKQIEPCVTRIPALLTVKPAHGQGPLTISYAPTNLLDVAPTVLKTLGKETRSVFDLDESLERQRPFIYFDGKGTAAKIQKYTINGSVFDPESCKRGGAQEINKGVNHFELGAEILFGMTGNADPFMDIGWSACQVDYCWSTGDQASLILETGEVTADLVMQVNFKPYVNESIGLQQSIGVWVNDTQLAEWHVSQFRFQDATVQIPAALVKEDTIRVRFEFPDAVSPKSIGLGADTRKLGLAIHSLRMDVVEPSQVGNGNQD